MAVKLEHANLTENAGYVGDLPEKVAHLDSSRLSSAY
jgi:hypothetical protein